MSQVTEQSVRFQTALASIKLIQASAVLDLTEDDFDFLTSRSEERFSRNAETDLVCRLLLEKKQTIAPYGCKTRCADIVYGYLLCQLDREVCLSGILQPL